MKYYIIKQVNATGNGHSTTIELVTDPKFENGGIHATKVGEIDWVNYRGEEDPIFKRIESRDFMICGNVTCEECLNPFAE